MTQYKVIESVHKLDVMDGGIAGLGPLSSTPKSILLDQRSSTVFIITLLISKFITQLPINNYLLTALRTSSRWPSTPPNIAIQTSVLMFHNLKA